jgi:uncharacterized protein (TIGR02452 family)
MKQSGHNGHNHKKGRALDVTSDRAANRDIALDTLAFLEEAGDRFAPQVAASLLYNEEQLNEPHATKAARVGKPTGIEVTDETTLQALYRLSRECGDSPVPRVCILNFASAKNPGGGFKKGSAAQEESLARSSSLYPCLAKFLKPFYVHNKSKPGVYTHRIIYCPQVTFFKDDAGNMQPETTCAVVTAPAVNAGVAKLDEEEVRHLMAVRMRKILRVAVLHDLRVLVLGAFGCGVFKNSPAVVAGTWRDLLATNEFRDRFERIVFACYGPKENLLEFQRMFR